MRIITGKFGGRGLKSVPSHKTRPTTDRVKEALFNIIGPYFRGGTFLDLFAGSGGVGIEAASRGASKVVMVDRQYLAYQTIKRNVAITKSPELFSIYKMSAQKALSLFAHRSLKFNFVYLDPPYRLQRMVRDLGQLSRLSLLAPKAKVICETDRYTYLPDSVPNYKLLRRKEYGITIVTIYKYMEG